MAVVWQATGTLLGSTGADITPVIPAHATNDILILQAATRTTTETLLTPSGWTLISGPNNTGSIWRTYWFWIRATSSSMTDPLCDWSAAGGDKYGVVHNIRGAITSGSPLADTGIPAVGATDPINVSGVTTTAANQFVCSMGLVADNAATAVTVTATDPTSFTQRTYTTITTGADAGQFFTDGTRATAGATGAVSHDYNGVPLASGVLVLAILSPSTTSPSSSASASLSPSSSVSPSASASASLSPSSSASPSLSPSASASPSPLAYAGKLITNANNSFGVQPNQSINRSGNF